MFADVAGQHVQFRKASDSQGSFPTRLPFLTCLGWLVLLPVVIPNLREDRGIFVSVAERLLAGDILYQDVWDNKDPLFYYTIALGRLISPYADIILELLWLFTACAAATMIARWRGCQEKAALFSGFLLTPIILTGGMYVAGMTHLPGIAVALMATAVAFFCRYTMAGALLAILAFLKIVMLPVAFVLVLAVVLRRRHWTGLVRAAAGFVLVAGLVTLVLHVRGELIPYLRSLVLNVSYSQGVQGDSGLQPVVEHLLRVLSLPFILTLATLCSGLVLLHRARRKRCSPDADSEAAQTFFTCQLLALCAGLAVLATTGMWDHHGQVMYTAAVLLAVDLVTNLQKFFFDKPEVIIWGSLCFAVLLSGTAGPVKYYESLTTVGESLEALTEPSIEARSVLSIAADGTYARVGQNYDGGHAYGLSKWNLKCPRFHQYPFDSRQHLQDTADCLSGAKVVLVDASAAPVDGQREWNAYLERVNAILEAEYLCNREQDMVCTQR